MNIEKFISDSHLGKDVTGGEGAVQVYVGFPHFPCMMHLSQTTVVLLMNLEQYIYPARLLCRDLFF